MVSVLAIRPKIRGFKPGRGCEFLRVIKIHCSPSFGREVKPLVSCREILRHVKMACKYEEKYFARPNPSFPSTVPPVCYQMTLLIGLPEISGARIRNFPLTTTFHRGSPSSCITWRMKIGRWWL
jgi:hypothetical protein